MYKAQRMQKAQKQYSVKANVVLLSIKSISFLIKRTKRPIYMITLCMGIKSAVRPKDRSRLLFYP